jgi:hypothetical protein
MLLTSTRRSLIGDELEMLRTGGNMRARFVRGGTGPLQIPRGEMPRTSLRMLQSSRLVCDMIPAPAAVTGAAGGGA